MWSRSSLLTSRQSSVVSGAVRQCVSICARRLLWQERLAHALRSSHIGLVGGRDDDWGQFGLLYDGVEVGEFAGQDFADLAELQVDAVGEVGEDAARALRGAGV